MVKKIMCIPFRKILIYFQIFLPLVCFVLNAQGDYLDTIAGLRRFSQPDVDPRNEEFNSNFKDWFHHFDTFPTSVHGRRPYLSFNPYYNRDPYYSGDLWDQMPQINNVFNIPSGHNTHSHQGHRENKPEPKPKPDHVDDVLNVEEPTEKPGEIPTIDKPIEQEPTNKLEEAIKADIKNQSELIPPKTNKINENDDKSDKDDKSVELNEKKDYLLVGQGNNGNDVYLLHENLPPAPAPAVIPNNNQPANNVIYVPSSPGPSPSNQVYQILNGPSPMSNLQLSPDKLGVNNDAPVSIPPTSNVNPASQPNNVVTVYSNGQIIQIPGVVVVPNNAPVDVGNQPQTPSYVVANVVPNNNVQPTNQNTGPNVYYAAVPNQGSNNPIYYLQVPNQGVNNAGNVVLNNGLPGNVVAYQISPNVVTQPAVSNGYVQSNIPSNQGVIAVAIPNQGVMDNANNQYQVVVVPQGSPSNVYNQQVQPNQGLNPVMMLNGQSVPAPTVQVPAGNNVNGYNQPILASERQEVSPLNQGSLINNQNVGIQGAVLIPSNGGYYQPPITNQVQNVPSQVIETPTNGGSYIQPAVLYDGNQNVPSQPMVSVNDAQVPIQGGQASNTIPDIAPVNTADVVAPPEENAPVAIASSPLILDGDNLEALGVQPAVMLTGFKDSEDGKKDKKGKEEKKDKKGKDDKKDKKEGKERKEKSKKKSKKDKDEKSGEVFTN
ncbi:AT-rich interactive domain-containing protein 2-like [Spodoptera frugiperda]|uniref:AT-rich interactive domain-containing protein 2-like n=1 Tax=Spodoptera frugiperda TaxID=7108 RepID=A0A9R0EWU0_SPOFR|nr:AT-rich interactive domain-containing protein 2-like [Spodoptera frugiperda]